MKLHHLPAPQRPTAGHRVASRGKLVRLEARVLRAGETHMEVQLRASIYATKRRLREAK
jgi:acyl-CoA hydrolase